jgi:hypothetical protein
VQKQSSLRQGRSSSRQFFIIMTCLVWC